MSYKEILQVIADCGSKKETVEIEYPATETSAAGWREVEPYSLRTNTGGHGEKLDYKSDEIEPHHFFYGYTVNSSDSHCDAFKIGKILDARVTGKKFVPKWDVEF